MLKTLQPFQNAGEKLTSQMIGEALGKFDGDRAVIRSRQNELGQLITQSNMKATKVDVAIYNSGGMRNSFEKGPISYRDVIIVHPFGNTLVTVEITGKELKEYFEDGLNRKNGDGAYLQFTGAKIKMKGTKITSMQVQGKKMDEKKKYKISLPSFVATGGSGFRKFVDHPSYVDTGYLSASALKDFIQNLKKVDPKNFSAKGILIRK
jgi:5'-nucleotidase/UDP-sugar diphosphatase